MFLQPVTREIIETGIGSIHAPIQQQCWQSNVPIRFFDTPLAGLESIDEGVDFDQHDMPEHDEMEPKTLHDSGDEPTVDDQETFSGATWVKSTGSLDLTILVDDACVSIKIQNIAGIY